MIKFDDEKAAKRLMAEEPWMPYEKALRRIKSRHNWDERLQTAFDIWIEGGIPEFEFGGITLEWLKKMDRSKGYNSALCSMDLILQDPEKRIPYYSDKKNFIRM